MVQRASESPLKGQALAGRQSPRSGVLYQEKSMLLTRAAEGYRAPEENKGLPLTATGFEPADPGGSATGSRGALGLLPNNRESRAARTLPHIIQAKVVGQRG